MTADLEATLGARRREGRKLLVCYLMAGSTPDWLDVARRLLESGADALEVGLAFSDPMIDGPVIQEAATRAIGAGITSDAVLDELGAASLGAPVVAMTYCNVLLRHGYVRAARALGAAGVTGAIVADLPLEELGAWRDAADPEGIATVLLAAPSTPPERLDSICARSQGFVYAVGRMATTGEAEQLDPRGIALVAALRARTSLPVCLGVGVSTPEHAEAACEVADGVVVGSAIVRRMLHGATPREIAEFAVSLRRAID